MQSRTLSDRMTSAASIFLSRIAKSREEQGDITLKCEGKDIKAHSLILQDRITSMLFTSWTLLLSPLNIRSNRWHLNRT